MKSIWGSAEGFEVLCFFDDLFLAFCGFLEDGEEVSPAVCGWFDFGVFDEAGVSAWLCALEQLLSGDMVGNGFREQNLVELYLFCG